MQLLKELLLALGADDPRLGLAVPEQDEGRDAHHFKAAGDLEVLVDVQLDDPELAGVFTGNFFQYRR